MTKERPIRASVLFTQQQASRLVESAGLLLENRHSDLLFFFCFLKFCFFFCFKPGIMETALNIFPWKVVEQYLTVVLFVFQFYPVYNFGKFIDFGLGSVRSEMHGI